jgi:hypothetical protein
MNYFSPCGEAKKLRERQIANANIRTWELIGSHFAKVNWQIRDTGWYFQLGTADLSILQVSTSMKVWLYHKDHSDHFAVYKVIDLVGTDFLFRSDCYEHILNNPAIKTIIESLPTK